LAGFCTGFAIGGGGVWDFLINERKFPFLGNRLLKDVPAELLHLQIGLELSAKFRGLFSGNGEELINWRNERFQRAVPERCLREADVVIGFDTSSLTLVKRCRELERPFILVQTIGHPAEKERIFECLRRLYPDWNLAIPRKSEVLIECEREEHRLADLIVAPSHYVAETLTSNGVDKSKVCFIPFGADLDMFRPKEVARSNGPLVFLFVGAVSARKGIATLFDAWSAMGTSDAELWVVGSGFLPRSQVKGLPSSIKLLGAATQADIAELMRKSDVFVLPSFIEGMAKVLVEALSSGLPVISTREAGAEDVIVDGCNGFIVAAGNSHQLSERMKRLLDDRQLLARMRLAAIGGRNKLSWSIYGSRWAEVLGRTMTQHDNVTDAVKKNPTYNNNAVRQAVLIAHPGTQYSYSLAEELERRGRLFTFHTGVAISRNSVFGKLVSNLSTLMRRKWADNRIVDLPSAKVCTHPTIEIRRMIMEFFRNLSNEEILHRRNETFQLSIPEEHINRSTLVVGYDTSSWLLARRVKERNGKFILDQSIGHPVEKERILDGVRDRFPEWSVTLPRKLHTYVAEEIVEHKLADLIVVPSSFVRKTLLDQGVPEAKIRVIPFGTNLSFFHPGEAPRPAGPVVFLFVGSLSGRKGVPVLLESWRRMGASNSRLWLVGGGSVPRHEASNLPTSIALLGSKNRAEVAELMRRADVFVFPSFFEGLAQVQVEALASGLPLISTIEAGAGDLVRNGQNGFLVPTGDVNALSERMLQVAADKDLLVAMRKTAVEERAQLSWSVYGDRWAKVLDEFV
jgi:glycosyltransferase involved in cell wall biosynthesis